MVSRKFRRCFNLLWLIRGPRFEKAKFRKREVSHLRQRLALKKLTLVKWVNNLSRHLPKNQKWRKNHLSDRKQWGYTRNEARSGPKVSLTCSRKEVRLKLLFNSSPSTGSGHLTHSSTCIETVSGNKKLTVSSRLWIQSWRRWSVASKNFLISCRRQLSGKVVCEIAGKCVSQWAKI